MMRLLLIHPNREDLSLAAVLYALGDPIRLRMVAQLARWDGPDDAMACQDFHVGDSLAKSTVSFHLKVLREAGLVRMVPRGRRVLVSLRREDLAARFPGLLESVLASYPGDGLIARTSERPDA